MHNWHATILGAPHVTMLNMEKKKKETKNTDTRFACSLFMKIVFTV